MKYYIKTDSNNIVRDVITFPFNDYMEIESNELPIGVNGGWFKFENGTFVEYPELKPEHPLEVKMKEKDEEIAQLKETVNLIQAALDDMLLGGGI